MNHQQSVLLLPSPVGCSAAQLVNHDIILLFTMNNANNQLI